jgi:nitronate monooxygenase
MRVPIVNAPMGGVAGGALAAAVSAAGGLGMIGVGSAGSVEMLVREAEIPRNEGVRFGVGLLSWAVERDERLLSAAIGAGPVLISVSFGSPRGWIERVHDVGIAAATQVYDVAMARKAAEAGVDVIVARGSEGGGHGANAVATLPLLQGVLDAVQVPVLAAGGIATGRGLAAVLAAGAAGAWMGTPFLASSESLLGSAARREVLASDETDTIYTRVFDVTSGNPWPAEYGERVLTSRFALDWTGREDELMADEDALGGLVAARETGAFEALCVDAGQAVGMVDRECPAAEIVAGIGNEAASLLAVWGGATGSAQSAATGGTPADST